MQQSRPFRTRGESTFWHFLHQIELLAHCLQYIFWRNPMAQKFETVEQLTSVISKMTILQLRELARDFDVIPRNLPRDELIRRITASYNGEIEPEIRIKSGRPTKKVKLAQKQGIDDLYYSDA
ncbi:MAG: hypothetical protein II209_01500, partial [Alistipes sp.]|nr:hypothetical protein [Alistipes sp.]